MIADTLEAILGHAGYKARATYSGEEGVALARTFRPDVVIADYHMPPGLNGIEASVAIKKMFPGVRIIMLSGQMLGEEFAPFRLKGFNFLLLSKPIHPGDLVDKVRCEDVVIDESVNKQPRILNVDDVEQHRYSISRVLARAGFEVSEAETGKEALTKALEIQPDLILLDIHLPDVNGYDVCKELRRMPETARIAVVHITASDKSAEAAMRSANVGADEYLTHPIVPKRLVHRIRELLQMKYLESDSPSS